MRFSMLYSREQVLSFKPCLLFYAGDALRETYERNIVWIDIQFLWSPSKTLSPHKCNNCKIASVEIKIELRPKNFQLNCLGLDASSLVGPPGLNCWISVAPAFRCWSCCWVLILFHLSVESWFMCLLFWYIDELEVLHTDRIICLFMNHSRT